MEPFSVVVAAKLGGGASIVARSIAAAVSGIIHLTWETRVGSVVGAALPVSSTQRAEALAQIVYNRLRLLPGSEMPAFRVIPEIGEIGVSLLGPGLRNRVDLGREGADHDGDGLSQGREEGQLVFPVEPRRGYSCPCQPIERDVVADVIARESLL